MPRWLQVVLNLALFTAAMFVVRLMLHASVPGAVDWASSMIGLSGVWALFIAAMAGCAFIGFWPRSADGRLQPISALRSRWLRG